MRLKDIKRHRYALLLAAGFGLACLPADPSVIPAHAQAVDAPLRPTQAPAQADAPVDATADLQRRRNETRGELEVLAKTMRLSAEKIASIEKSIADTKKNTADVRQALIASAARRKGLETKINDSEKKLAEFKVKEDGIRTSLRGRRAVLAEVLAALQRMGRNPPPALLVTPDDALASVRSAILLGAVVPGMRHEADKLVADLQSLSSLQTAALSEKTDVSTTIAASLEEDRRMDLLLAENEKLNRQNTTDLDAERRRSEELAGRANNLDGLIQSLEGEIASVREAIDRARAEEERRRMMSEAERERAKQLAESGVPDKNRIAPAYAFSSLKQKLELPVAGDVLRWFGDGDGTGHTARGMTVASKPGAVVTAPADGLVVFAGAFRSYGLMIILNAGDGYHLVLTGMDEVNARQGKFVFAGEPIAAMGEKRVASATALALETDRPTLYIEFRKDGTPVDSRPWWTAKETGRARNDS
ncbi:murein hydrolase activator EnvC [Rhizobium sp. XQZ8]|uniref:murein hydrolase activator EnvC family protein n=1 Tax=Rhizobium populisoli TaxID=2859785 RepID=UPI001C66CB2E|nr:murein hydrolase activator EnvC [Rhizobium populisoli]MBW6424501.1 murein hydrolase activator EnvC [Rhizobium populisoli]